MHEFVHYCALIRAIIASDRQQQESRASLLEEEAASEATARFLFQPCRVRSRGAVAAVAAAQHVRRR